MKIFVMGASGRVGQALTEQLANEGHEVYAGSRHPINADKKNIHPISVDLHKSVDELADLIKGMAAIYFVAGSRGKDLLQTDAFGAVKLAEAADKLGINRFIMLSSMFATQPKKWTNNGLTDYNIAKFFADNWLMDHTNLDYTILQPGALVEGDPTGKVALNVDEGGKNQLADVATVLAEILEAKNTYRRIITMHEGQEDISEAIAAFK